MYRVSKEVAGFDGALKYVDSCPNQPAEGMAFCEEHCKAADAQGIPCSLKEFRKYSIKGKAMYTYVSIALCVYITDFSPATQSNALKIRKDDQLIAADCQGSCMIHVLYLY